MVLTTVSLNESPSTEFGNEPYHSGFSPPENVKFRASNVQPSIITMDPVAIMEEETSTLVSGNGWFTSDFLPKVVGLHLP